MIEIVQGDLLESTERYIAHQCNCVTNKSAHLAWHVFKKFPYADIYSAREKSDEDNFGDIIIRGNGKDQRYVINMLGQIYPGAPKYSDGKDCPKTRENAFWSCLMKVALIDSLESVAFPFGIACGAAGGNWNNYFKMLEDFESMVDARVVIYKK